MTKVMFRLCAFFGSVVLCLLTATTALPCGTERWNVKVVQDSHNKFFFQNNDITSGVLQIFKKTTIADLHDQPYPFGLNPKKFPPKEADDQRKGIAEFRMWTITAVLTEKKNEKDEDYHLILRDGDKTMVAEIPAPGCVEESPEPLKSMILAARSDFDEWLATQPNKKKFNQKVRITGLGFFDRVHGSEGESPNGIELHPVIKIKFLKK